MKPINNSDTAWLIVSDYNQDNDLPYEELREDILNPQINNWSYDYEYRADMLNCFASGPHSAIARLVGGCSTQSYCVGDELQYLPNYIPAINPIYNFDNDCALLVGGNRAYNIPIPADSEDGSDYF